MSTDTDPGYKVSRAGRAVLRLLAHAEEHRIDVRTRRTTDLPPYRPDSDGALHAHGTAVSALVRAGLAAFLFDNDERPIDQRRRVVLTDRGRYAAGITSPTGGVRVTFTGNRIGRHWDAEPLTLRTGHPEEILSAVYTYAARRLTSRTFDVAIDTERTRGWIGGGRFGTFTIEPLDDPGRS